MKKAKKKISKAIIIELALILIVSVGFGLYFVQVQIKARNNPPQIVVAESDNIFSVSATEDDLTADVSATDKEDGDVTESLVIEAISPIFEKHTRTVTYVAFDSDNNVTKLDREIKYKDYQPPQIICDKTIYVPSGEYTEILSKVSATDVIDGDISSHVKIEINNVVRGVPGRYSAQLTVTNSCGDIATKSIVVAVTGEED